VSFSLGGKAERLETDVLILAVPAYSAAEMLGPLDAPIAQVLNQIPYAPLSVCALGYRKETLEHPLDGFGFLIPVEEGRTILGCLWDSSMFPGRAPEGFALLRAMAGGARRPEIAGLPEDALIRAVKDDLRETMGIRTEPVFTRVFRHPRAIPNYNVGHGRRLEKIQARLLGLPGLVLTGNAFRGIGINDCTRNALVAAREALSLLAE